MAESTQQCKWCLRASPPISRRFTAIELRVHIEAAHPTVMVLSVQHRCPYDACGALFDFASEVKEHLQTVHDGLVGEWNEREEKTVWGMMRSPESSTATESKATESKGKEAPQQAVQEKSDAKKEVEGQTKAWRPKNSPNFSLNLEILRSRAQKGETHKSDIRKDAGDGRTLLTELDVLQKTHREE